MSHDSYYIAIAILMTATELRSYVHLEKTTAAATAASTLTASAPPSATTALPLQPQSNKEDADDDSHYLLLLTNADLRLINPHVIAKSESQNAITKPPLPPRNSNIQSAKIWKRRKNNVYYWLVLFLAMTTGAPAHGPLCP